MKMPFVELDTNVPAGLRFRVLAAMALLSALGLLGTALSPYLLVEHPLALLGLNPDGRHLVLVAGSVDAWQAIAVAAPRRLLTVLGIFGVAYLYGPAMLERAASGRPRLARLIATLEGIYARFGIWLVLLVPFHWVAALAGAARMPFRRFTLASMPGQVVFAALFLEFGEAISGYTDAVLDWLAPRAVDATLLAVAAILFVQLLRRQARARVRSA